MPFQVGASIPLLRADAIVSNGSIATLKRPVFVAEALRFAREPTPCRSAYADQVWARPGWVKGGPGMKPHRYRREFMKELSALAGSAALLGYDLTLARAE